MAPGDGLRTLGVAVCPALGFLAAWAISRALGALELEPLVATWAATALGAVLASLAVTMREMETPRDGVLLSAAGAWAGAGTLQAGTPVAPLVGMLAALVVAAGSSRFEHRALALIVALGSAAALALSLPPEWATYQVHAAIVAVAAPLLTVALVDEDRRLRGVCAALALVASGVLFAWSARVAWKDPVTLNAAILIMSAAAAVTAAVAVRKMRAPARPQPA